MLRKIMLVFLAAVILFGGGMGISFWRGIHEIKAMKIGEVNLQGVPDGVYKGEALGGAINVVVDVAVQGGKITDIQILKHDNGKGKAAEGIVGRVVAEQSLAVDLVSGATYSSKVILKAVESALE